MPALKKLAFFFTYKISVIMLAETKANHISLEENLMKKRPTGISVLFWVYLILGVLSFLWSGMVLGIGGLSAFFGGLFGMENVTSFGNASAWSGYVGIIAAVVQIIVAFGLSAMKRWAWILALVGIGLTLVQGAVGMLSGGLFGLICGSLGLFVPLIILFYLLRADIRAAFGIGQPNQSV
jgi:hypothetical protein